MLFRDRFSTIHGRFNPWAEIERLHNEMNRLLTQHGLFTETEFPPVNVWGNEDKILINAELPGITPDDIEISVAGKTLNIKGKKEAEKEGENDSYHRRERWYGDFTRKLELPFPVDSSKVEAKFSKGVLLIVLPRLEADKPKKIAIEVK
ncbi:MAG: Hsp20/alpha crystallin family protein [Syntrophorhabdaceae bacterium]|nr:Hsp20/alpha crystallin family protein [Syntrophorhabdaceae bacterium]